MGKRCNTVTCGARRMAEEGRCSEYCCALLGAIGIAGGALAERLESLMERQLYGMYGVLA